MSVGFALFEVGAVLSLGSVKRSGAPTPKSHAGFLRKHLDVVLTRVRPSLSSVLLFSIALYLVLSRCGPVLSRVGEATYQAFDLKNRLLHDCEDFDIQVLQGLYKIFKGVTRVPGPFARSSFGLLMGNKASKDRTKADPKEDDSVRVESSEQPSKDASCDSKKGKKRDGDGSKENPRRLSTFEDSISTGDLAILKREGEDIYHFAIFIQNDECDPTFPLLLIKGKTKPLEVFKPASKRHAHLVTAANRIFYGDYETVSVRKVVPQVDMTCHDTMKIVDEIPNVPFSDVEIAAIQGARSPGERSAILCTFMIAHFYKKMGILATDPNEIRPDNLEANLDLSEPTYVKLPPVKEGPVARGNPPFLSKLVNGIMPPPDMETVPLSSLIPKLQTGDLILFSGATSSGAVIKFFDNSQFSHIGIVIKTKFSSQMLIWEASTNKAGLVDIESGKVRKGVELLPLTNKVFSGWYDRVAVRRLTGIEDAKRQEMYEGLLKFRKEVQGRPYEKHKTELILSAFDFQEEYLSFLRNTKEDLSSLFCSELVAEAYKRMGLLTGKLSNEYTPDDFSSKNDKELNLQFGKLEKEEYVELKFDFD